MIQIVVAYSYFLYIRRATISKEEDGRPVYNSLTGSNGSPPLGILARYDIPEFFFGHAAQIIILDFE